MGSQILLEYKRAGLTEVRKFGSLCWVHGREIVHLCGENTLFYGRSSAKPLHLKIFAKSLENILTWEEKAISVASHNAENFHLHIVDNLLNKELQTYLQVPKSLPLRVDPLIHKTPETLYHPCSGEHSAMIRGCLEKKWAVNDYTLLTHPFHQAYLTYLRSVLGAKWTPQFIAKDGCGLGTVSFTLHELGLLYANLIKEKDEDWIWETMVRNPSVVGGSGRLDSSILKHGEGRVLAKEGADGLLAMSLMHPEYPEGLGIIIKLEQGSDSQAMWYIARGILGSLGWTIPTPARPFRQSPVLNPEIVPELYRERLKIISSTFVMDAVDDRFS